MLRYLFLLFLLAPVATQACVCRKTTLERQLVHSTAVFVAEVQASQTRQSPTRLTVIRHIKGNYPVGSRIDAESWFGDCSASDLPGAQLLVFFDDFASDRRTLSACSAFLVAPLRIGEIDLQPRSDVLDFLRTTATDYVAKKNARARTK